MTTRTPSCRSCGHRELEPILSLGPTPLVNALSFSGKPGAEVETFPLDLVFCPQCTLVQILETVSPERLFRDYPYFSSVSDTMLQHAQWLADDLLEKRQLGSRSLVVEAGSNDGYLLRCYREAGVPVLGIEPAETTAQAAREAHGIPTVENYFGEEMGRWLRTRGNRADVFHAHNVLAHVADLNGFVAGIALALADSGVAVIEVPYVKDLVDRGEFDTIYHEHLCYFSLTALHRLFKRHDLRVTDVQRVPIHGGSLRLYVQTAEAEQMPAVGALLAEEAGWGVETVAFYQTLGARAGIIRNSLRELIGDLKKQGKRIAAYGASAKGCVLLNYCGIDSEVLDFVVDRCPAKQGKFVPGVRLPIVAPPRLLSSMPDHVLLLVWNLADEVLRQQHEYRRRGGKFIVPVPEVKVA
jgi:hypothetical protein